MNTQYEEYKKIDIAIFKNIPPKITNLDFTETIKSTNDNILNWLIEHQDINHIYHGILSAMKNIGTYTINSMNTKSTSSKELTEELSNNLATLLSCNYDESIDMESKEKLFELQIFYAFGFSKIGKTPQKLYQNKKKEKFEAKQQLKINTLMPQAKQQCAENESSQQLTNSESAVQTPKLTSEQQYLTAPLDITAQNYEAPKLTPEQQYLTAQKYEAFIDSLFT